MASRDISISNEKGLHARAAAALTKVAGRYPCEVWISRGSRRVNAKSILGVMMLAAGKGSTVVLETVGDQEAEALEALVHLVEHKFWEDEFEGQGAP